MSDVALIESILTPAEIPPTEDDLPCDDGEPMETWRHVLQMQLLLFPLHRYWADRQDFFAGGNMFVYFSPEQVKNYNFKGPDVFVVQGVPRRERKSWVVWQEGKGPDVVIELLSESTAIKDKTEKKQVYQDRLRVPEYFWYDPYSGELAGFSLREGGYIPIEPDSDGNLTSRQLHLKMIRWNGVYFDTETTWLRWATLEGQILPTPEEAAEEERHRAEEERHRAEEEHQRAKEEYQRAEALKAELARYRAKFGNLPQ
jgi:Uma2 family endonuclease